MKKNFYYPTGYRHAAPKEEKGDGGINWEVGIDTHTHTHTHTHTYIYTYIHIYMYIYTTDTMYKIDNQ